MKKITIVRRKSDTKETLGNLVTDGFACKTLERPWLNNVPQVSCIPEGVYICKWTFSPRFMRYMYEVQNVPGRSGIRIHKGNYFFDVVGCILLGNGYVDLNNDGNLDIVNSTITIEKFEKFMNGETFELTITHV